MFSSLSYFYYKSEKMLLKTGAKHTQLNPVVTIFQNLYYNESVAYRYCTQLMILDN